MENRLWTNPPLKPDGTLDYARLTLAEICEDLTETLLDLIENGGQVELRPFLDDLPDLDQILEGADPTPTLVQAMEKLLLWESKAPGLSDPEAWEPLDRAVRELRQLSSFH